MKQSDGQEGSWGPSHLAAGAGFEPARGFPLNDNPNSTARRKPWRSQYDGQEVLWLRNRMAGLEPASPGLAPDCSLAVELHPHRFQFGAIIHNERPIEI